jgi:UDP-N-acetylmuramyl pentapeptide synthase
MPQTLAHHLAHLPAGSIIARYGNQNIPIEAPFVESSRDVRQGGVFVARRGDNVDGHRFILQALEAGAVAIIGESHPTNCPIYLLKYPIFTFFVLKMC